MTDETSNDFRYLAPGKTVQITETANPRALIYKGESLRIIMNDPVGILAQVAKNNSDDMRPALFIPFDGTTRFAFVAPGYSQYREIVPSMQVIDLEQGLPSTMGEFYPQFFEEKARRVAEAAANPPPAPAPAPVGAPVVDTSWLRDFQPGAVFRVVTSTNPHVVPYCGRIFQVVSADVEKIVAYAEQSSGLSGVFTFPVDGTTDYDFPAGTFTFPTGATGNQPVYNTITGTTTTVEYYYPSVGLFWDPFPPLFVPTIVPTIGFGVVYDPFYVYDPFWPYF